MGFAVSYGHAVAEDNAYVSISAIDADSFSGREAARDQQFDVALIGESAKSAAAAGRVGAGHEQSASSVQGAFELLILLNADGTEGAAVFGEKLAGGLVVGSILRRGRIEEALLDRGVRSRTASIELLPGMISPSSMTPCPRLSMLMAAASRNPAEQRCPAILRWLACAALTSAASSARVTCMCALNEVAPAPAQYSTKPFAAAGPRNSSIRGVKLRAT